MTVTLRPQNVAGLFPNDAKRVLTYTEITWLFSLTIEKFSPIAVNQQRFSPDQADAIQREAKKTDEPGIIPNSTCALAVRCVTVRKKDSTLGLCQTFSALNGCMTTDSGYWGILLELSSGWAVECG